MLQELVIGALFYGDHLGLAQRCLGTLGQALPYCDAPITSLRLGLNEPSQRVLEFVRHCSQVIASTCGIPVVLYSPERNVGKYPLMRRLLYDDQAPGRPELFMWFDDDSYLEENYDKAKWWREVLAAIAKHDMIGQHWFWPVQKNQWEWVQSQAWFNSQVGPPVKHRGKPAFKFCQGAWWVARYEMLRRFDWPTTELLHCGGDSMLGELLRHQGLRMGQFDRGVRINADEQGRHSKAKRRGWTGQQAIPLGKYFVPGQAARTEHQHFECQRTIIT